MGVILNLPRMLIITNAERQQTPKSNNLIQISVSMGTGSSCLPPLKNFLMLLMVHHTYLEAQQYSHFFYKIYNIIFLGTVL